MFINFAIQFHCGIFQMITDITYQIIKQPYHEDRFELSDKARQGAETLL